MRDLPTEENQEHLARLIRIILPGNSREAVIARLVRSGAKAKCATPFDASFLQTVAALISLFHLILSNKFDGEEETYETHSD